MTTPRYRPTPVDISLSTAIASACLLAAVGFGTWLGRSLPAESLSPESKNTVTLAMGMVATMAALLLGLLVNSAKTAYDTTRGQVMQKASKYALLDRVLAIYGPPGAEVRGKLHAVIEAETRRLWPAPADIPVQSKHDERMGNALYVALLRLEARDDAERALKAQAVSLALELGGLVALMEAESTTSIPKPMLSVVTLWLMIIFIGFSVIAPPNSAAICALIASASCSAGAIYLLLDLHRPFEGLMRVSSEPMKDVLRQLGT